MKINYRFHVNAIVGMVVLVGMLSAPATAGDTSRPIRVVNPDKLPAELPADRTHMGKAYKPSMVLLPNGELVMTALCWDGSYQTGDFHEWAKLWRSSDNGQNWSAPVRVKLNGDPNGPDLNGREHWLTSIDDGTTHGMLFSTAHLLWFDTANPTPGTGRAYINRSTDGGVTWTQTMLSSTWSHPSRNVVMYDGKLRFGATRSQYPNGPSLNSAWEISADNGVTWTETIFPPANHPTYTNWQGTVLSYNSPVGFFEEAYTYMDTSGKMRQFIRVGKGPMYPMDANPPTGNDGVDRTLMTTSADGMTWTPLEDCGDYGQHYTRVARLSDGRLMMTFTQRSVTEPLGLRVLLSYDDGQTWDFDTDHVILDENTPSGWAQGGGFGNTIQLPDGSLISCYSYHDAASGKGNYQTEVVRWSVTPIPEPSTGALLGVGALCLGTIGLVWKRGSRPY